LVHEFGHFIVARRNGVEVEEFGLGFPPKAYSKKTKKGFILSLNWLPLGGFVKLKGEHDADLDKGSFGRATLWAKTKIILAGVGMNLVAAFVILTFLAIIGLPQIINNQFSISKDATTTKSEVLAGYIAPDSPATKVGIKSQDELLSITNESGAKQIITSSKALPNITKSDAGQTVQVSYLYNGNNYSKTVKLNTSKVVNASLKTNNPKGYLGIEPTDYVIKRYTWAAPVVALGFMKQVILLTFKGIGTAIWGLIKGNTTQASSQVSGPVGIVVLLKNGSLLGYQFILMVVAIISLSLAIINVLPIPALDGGRLFFTLLPRAIRKRPLKQETEDKIHGAGMIAIMLLFVLITIVDIKRYF
jgi:regulator of sigma E protease